MKLSESIQSKIDKQRSVGHHSAAIVDYDLLNEWVYEAKQIEQKLLQHGVKRPIETKIEEDICDDLSYLPTAGVTPNGVALVAFDSVVEIVRKSFKAACARGAVDKTVSEGNKSKVENCENCTYPKCFCGG